MARFGMLRFWQFFLPLPLPLPLFLFLLIPTTSLWANPAIERLVLATYKLSNEASTATGLVVRHEPDPGRPRLYVVTADHVLSAMKGDSCMLISREPANDGSYHRREIQIPVRRNGNRLWKKHPEHDLAILRLPDSVGVGALPVEVLADVPPMSIGDSVCVATFPERFEVNGAGFPVLRSGVVASFPIVPIKLHPTFLVDVTSFSGDSGAPVTLSAGAVSGSLPEVVGIVLGKHRITETFTESKYVERKIHHPLGLSYAIHASYARNLIMTYGE